MNGRRLSLAVVVLLGASAILPRPAAMQTPPAIVQKLNADINTVLKDHQIREAIEKQGMTPVGGPPQRLDNLVKKELPRWHRVVSAAGIKAD